MKYTPRYKIDSFVSVASLIKYYVYLDGNCFNNRRTSIETLMNKIKYLKIVLK